MQDGWSGEQTSERKNERKNRKLAESTLQHGDEWRSNDAIMARADHDDVLCVGIAA
jgi:hypothetical protein